MHFLFCYRILYQTADNETSDDKAIIVNGMDGVYNKRPAVFKGNTNRNFDNVNFEDHKNVEYDEDNDDERSPVITNGDIV